MSDVMFKGPCKGNIIFFIKGTLLAPMAANEIKKDSWINFRYVDNLVVSGGGTIDGQGSRSWSFRHCETNTDNRVLPANMGFDFVRNSRITSLKSVNSKAGHLNFFAVDHFNITGVNIAAPGNSPNTDGIKIGSSSNMKIWNSHIGTGDDCIAILSRNTNFDI
ncbi:unnamed protein product [Arabis nemorensis]|uniref:Pectate lyase domain-containing protein n=1 Tax=Arabis nemorensis TaxID=586526 RepID=A0A565ASX9_9BRAS|nr:unnamed protein product [Arabis nemorensis]